MDAVTLMTVEGRSRILLLIFRKCEPVGVNACTKYFQNFRTHG